MRPTTIAALVSAALLCTWSCSQPSGSGTEAGSEAQAPVVQAPSQDSLHCADLNGRTFDITYYVNNAQHSTDVWHFVGDSIRSETYEKEGFGYLSGACRQRTATSVEGRARVFNKANVFVSINYTVMNGAIDGVFNRGSKGSRDQETMTFTGRMK